MGYHQNHYWNKRRTKKQKYNKATATASFTRTGITNIFTYGDTCEIILEHENISKTYIVFKKDVEHLLKLDLKKIFQLLSIPKLESLASQYQKSFSPTV